ncbi:MAG: magnesium/cobalt transporter CorA [Cephaloticoccus sp.]|nr:magnesium/cobalt transporter CorA [Cephaloticoccus sp.]
MNHDAIRPEAQNGEEKSRVEKKQGKGLTRQLAAGLSFSMAAMRKEGSVKAPPGSIPGIESFGPMDQPPAPDAVRLQWYDYGVNAVSFEAEGDLETMCSSERPADTLVRWINVDGLNPYVVNRLRQAYGIHTLAAEDVLRTSQRPKLEIFPNHLFVVVRMLTLRDGVMHQEQVSIFLFKDTLITFQETKGDVWDPIRQRLQKKGSRLRSMGPAYLLYALLDAVVDHSFPLLESYGEMLEELEAAVINDPQPVIQRQIHRIKRELVVLRRVLWPLREVVNELHRNDTEEIPAEVKTFMRDVYDHAVQVMEIIETYREQAGGLNDLYMSAVANRMNEIMKVLTIMASFFIPITFVAGVYGMNFEHIPELPWKYGYVGFWAVCVSIFTVLFVFFRRKGWLGGK